MGQTFAEQILGHASGRSDVQAGDMVVVNVDLVMMHDSLSPSIIETLHNELGAERVWDRDKVAVVIDPSRHRAPSRAATTSAALGRPTRHQPFV